MFFLIEQRCICEEADQYSFFDVTHGQSFWTPFISFMGIEDPGDFWFVAFPPAAASDTPVEAVSGIVKQLNNLLTGLN